MYSTACDVADERGCAELMLPVPVVSHSRQNAHSTLCNKLLEMGRVLDDPANDICVRT